MNSSSVNMSNLTRVITRKAPTLEQEREQFHRDQLVAISKALAPQETPVKLKHVRTIIIGTHQEHSSLLFWEIVQKAPIQGNPIVSWKFCHVLHKVLRDGHAKAIPEALRFKRLLSDTSMMWSHLPTGYGKLIVTYIKLINVKLDFHARNQGFPGNLQVTDSQLEAMAQDNIDAYFQLTVEMFDYMDEILGLQDLIFGSLDMSRANSMTASGQCRLAPLIPCIQDSSHLYDYTVKILFKLHSSLPPDTLSGHRERFRRQFDALRKFYERSRDLQYFKNLIQVPGLPNRPPNFLIEAERRNHVTPVVKLPAAPPEEDLGLVDVTDLASERSGPVDLLDASFGSQNGAVSPELIAEKDRTIEMLQSQLEEMRIEFEHMTLEYQRMMKELRDQITALKNEIADKDREIQALTETNQELLSQLTAREYTDAAVGKLEETEKKYQEAEQKFVKMKEIYMKLRGEHVELLRSKADIEKRFVAAEKSKEEVGAVERELKAQLDTLRVETDHLRRNTSSYVTEKEKIIAERQEVEKALEATRQELLALRSAKENAESEVMQARSASVALRNEMESREKQRLEAVLKRCIDEAKGVLREAVEFCEGPSQTSLTCQPDHVLTLIDPCLSSIEAVKQKEFPVSLASESPIDVLIEDVIRASRLAAGLALQGKAASNCSPDIEKGDRMGSTSISVAQEMLQALNSIENGSSRSEVLSKLDSTSFRVNEVRKLAEDLSLLLRGAKSSDLGHEVDEELHNMDKQIEDAAARIAAMLAKTKAGDTGLKLEVNGKILDSCTDLMAAIKNLVVKSKTLQAEIVSQGKGTVSASEFYKRNHRWTEGLLSAAKTVGNGAKCLVDAADKVVSVGVAGGAKFEEVIVASQEIAASTVQLVVASRVKASPSSTNLAELSSASKQVSQATGNVVATAKSCMELVEEKDVLDVGKLSLHQTKRLEMESQVRVISLEKELEKEREKLAKLRRHHYSTAGELEGWDEDVSHTSPGAAVESP